MDTLFPLGFPLATGFYLVLYVVTLVIHVVFMNYVLAGMGYLAGVSLFPGRNRCRADSPLAAKLRDWMPFALSAAITAGVAPLLFIQILYQHRFYTANLLGFHRWMSILPVLIVAFYLLYLIKSRRFVGWTKPLRIGINVLTWACFAFVAYSWTENYLLSVQDQSTWSRVYVDQPVFYRHPQLVPRLGMWFIGALPTMALLVTWQLWYAKRHDDPMLAGDGAANVLAADVRRAGLVALGGLVVTGGFGAWYYAVAGESLRSVFWSGLAGPYFIAAGAGVAIQAVAWLLLVRAGAADGRLLSLASVGTGLTVLGMSVVREALRLSAIDIASLYEQHKRAASVDGLVIFLLFFALNGVLVALCFRLVKRGLIRPAKG